MAQMFQGDANQNTNAVTLPNGTLTAVVTGNFMNPPFGNCKARVRGSCYITLGTVPTSLNVQINRNPSGENVIITSSGILTAGIAANGVIEVFVEGTDSIPDGRPVQYQLLITGAGTGTNDSSNRAYIEATLLSG